MMTRSARSLFAQQMGRLRIVSGMLPNKFFPVHHHLLIYLLRKMRVFVFLLQHP
jgi:hypothetical protein